MSRTPEFQMRMLVVGSALLLASFRVTGAAAQIAVAGRPVAGISCDAMEGSRIHIHQHLAIFDHGKPVAIPADVGRPQTARCLYWLHTHTPDGIIHIEAPADRSFTLGDFFEIWGQPLSRTQAASAMGTRKVPLKVWVDGKVYLGDPRKIVLASHTDITIQAGPPFTKPTLFTTWGTL
jgi:hypothetical protein